VSYEYFAVCMSCRSSWMVLRSQAGFTAAAASVVDRPGDFRDWLSRHVNCYAGVVVLGEDGMDAMEHDCERSDLPPNAVAADGHRCRGREEGER
jgi:hypothetical protein